MLPTNTGSEGKHGKRSVGQNYPEKQLMFMKPAIGKSQEGSVLVMAVVICALIGSVLCSYLVLISGRNERAMRALAWISEIPVLEAGLEEALTHLQDDKNNPTANDWTVDRVTGHKVYWKYR